MKKILIADDQEEVIRLLEFKLKAAGYEVVSSRDGVACLKKIADEKPDLLILDICMPGLDGNEVAAQLKKRRGFKEIPIIFLTALRNKEDEETEGCEVADHTIFAKPFNPVEVIQKIREMIGD